MKCDGELVRIVAYDVGLFAIDLEHHLLPNAITLPGIVAGVVFSLLFPPGPLASAIGILVGGGSLWLIGEAYYRYAGQEGMGLGDVKMLGMIGALLGPAGVVVTVLLASLSGSVVGLAVILARGGGGKTRLPFGVFLALGAVVAWFFGEPLVARYRAMWPQP